MIAAVVTTMNRPAALARTLPQVCALGWPVLVVDDGSSEKVASEIAAKEGAECLHLPTRRGLAASLTIGVIYWLADPAVEWISVFQDDVDVRPSARMVLEQFAGWQCEFPLITGHDAAEHAVLQAVPAQTIVAGRAMPCDAVLKGNCRATHLHAHRNYWMRILPVPSVSLGAPHRVEGELRGRGSNVDWWIVRNSPNSIVQKGGLVLCIPGLVRTFLWKREDSTWDNLAPEEPPL